MSLGPRGRTKTQKTVCRVCQNECHTRGARYTGGSSGEPEAGWTLPAGLAGVAAPRRARGAGAAAGAGGCVGRAAGGAGGST